MRGLLVKDWKICKRVLLPMLALYLAFDAVAGIIGTEQSMLREYSPVMAAVIAASVVGDEIRSGYAFSMTLPFDAKTFVLEKNLFFLLTQAATWALSKVVMAVILMVSGRPAPETGEFFFSGLWMVLLVLIFLGWLFAASLRFDAERFRMVLLGVVFGITILGLAAVAAVFSANTAVAKILDFIYKINKKAPPSALMLGGTGIALALWGLSAVAAVHAMKNRDF